MQPTLHNDVKTWRTAAPIFKPQRVFHLMESYQQERWLDVTEEAPRPRTPLRQQVSITAKSNPTVLLQTVVGPSPFRAMWAPSLSELFCCRIWKLRYVLGCARLLQLKL